MRLKDKVVIITGSLTGIGKAIAAACLREGARVVIHGRNAGQGAAVLQEFEEAGFGESDAGFGESDAGLRELDAGRNTAQNAAGVSEKTTSQNAAGAARDTAGSKTALHIEDITVPGAPERLVEAALNAFGRLDAVVNNAAMVTSSNIHTTDLELFRTVLETNTLAPFALIKAALPHLRETGGCVLNIGSVNAWSGEPNLFSYSVSKGALMTLTRNLGDTLHREDGVRVNQLNVGWVLTEKEVERKKEHGLPDDWYTLVPRVYAPAGRILKPEEIAMAAVYWLADESGPISGQVVELEQHPMIGRNPPKDPSTIPS